MKKQRYSLVQRGRWFFRLFITDAGDRMLSCAVLAAMLTLVTPAYHLFFIIVWLIILAILIGWFLYPRVRVAASWPEKIIAGKPVSIPMRFTNRSRFPTYDLAATFVQFVPSLRQTHTEECIPHLAGNESASYDFHFEALRRGLYQFTEAQPFSTFPFNLFRHGSRRGKKRTLLVLPDFHPLQHLDVEAEIRYQPGGIALASLVGESPEYVGNRPFQAGDSPRKIDTRAWARLAIPIVKEYHEEYYCHVAVVLDTFVGRRRKPGPSGFPEFEAAVSLTAAIADNLSRNERIIDFFAAGPDLYVFRSGRHTAHFENLLDILAAVEHCPKNPFEVVTPALHEQLNQTSSVVFILLDWDPHREDLVRQAAEAGCHTKIFVIRQTPTSHSFEDAQIWAGPVTVLQPAVIQQGNIDHL